MTDAEMYAHFSNLIQRMPNIEGYYEADHDRAATDRWLARAHALIQHLNNLPEMMAFDRAHDEILNERTYQAAKHVNAIILRAHASLELKVSPSSPGGFIAVGSPFDAHRALVGIFAEAKSIIMVVDPYMDDKILTEFMLVAPEGIEVQLLSDKHYYKPAMKVVSEKWVKQYGDTRPLEAKLTPERALHDRLIIIDNENVWNVSQSFKDFAARSPASIIRFDKETAALKVSAYNKMWDDAAII